MNPNWHRWIHASLRTYVKTELEKLSVVVFFEGDSREQLGDKTDWVEFRWNGPEIRKGSKDYWHLDVILNFVVQSTTGRTDTYTHQKTVGQVHSILKQSIGVFRYGDDPLVDDQQLLGCLQLRADLKDPIMTNYFGRMQEVEIEESTIEAYYCMSGKLT